MRAQLFTIDSLIAILILLALIIIFFYLSYEFGLFGGGGAKEIERQELYRKGEEIIQGILTSCEINSMKVISNWLEAIGS